MKSGLGAMTRTARAHHGAEPETRSTPFWQRQARRSAVAWVDEHGLPTAKDEDWRYFPHELLAGLTSAPAVPTDRRFGDKMRRLLGERLGSGPRLVFCNGAFRRDLSTPAALAPGVRVTRLAWALQADDGALRGALESVWLPYRNALEALNAIHALDGALVQLAPHSRAEDPIEIVHVAVPPLDTTGAGTSLPMACTFNAVLAGSNSTCVILERSIGIDGRPVLLNAKTLCVLDEGAAVTHDRLQDEAVSALSLSFLTVHQGRDSQYRSRRIGVGGRVARDEITVRLAGKGASVELDGLFLPTGQQYHDHPIRIEHLAGDTRSRQLYKGVVDGAARGVFNGHVIVHPGADKADAGQLNKNLLLSERAEVDTRPRLEIFADDVMCTHGAAIGHLDHDVLFYLRSRGIGLEQARSLLTRAFAEEVVDQLESGSLRALVERRVRERLAAPSPGGGGPGGVLGELVST